MLVWGIGEVLWDLFPDGERFGGAALNFCANLQRLGEQAVLFSAVARDDRGHLALERMRSLGLSTDGIQIVEQPPTGTALVTMTAAGEPSFLIPRPAAFDMLCLTADTVPPAERPGEEVPPPSAVPAQPDWLYFGTLLQTEPRVEQFTTAIAETRHGLRCFYDMNLRTGHWNLALVKRLSRRASILKLNEHEAETLFSATQPAGTHYSLESFCRQWSGEYAIDVLCITLGAAGCFVYDRGVAVQVPGFAVAVEDTVGSGDAFAAAFLHGYQQGWPTERTARFANALGALVASRAGATPVWSVAECLALAGQTAQPEPHRQAGETAAPRPQPGPGGDSFRTDSR